MRRDILLKQFLEWQSLERIIQNFDLDINSECSEYGNSNFNRVLLPQVLNRIHHYTGIASFAVTFSRPNFLSNNFTQSRENNTVNLQIRTHENLTIFP